MEPQKGLRTLVHVVVFSVIIVRLFMDVLELILWYFSELLGDVFAIELLKRKGGIIYGLNVTPPS
jgi:hypothetical protein